MAQTESGDDRREGTEANPVHPLRQVRWTVTRTPFRNRHSQERKVEAHLFRLVTSGRWIHNARVCALTGFACASEFDPPRQRGDRSDHRSLGARAWRCQIALFGERGGDRGEPERVPVGQPAGSPHAHQGGEELVAAERRCGLDQQLDVLPGAVPDPVRRAHRHRHRLAGRERPPAAVEVEMEIAGAKLMALGLARVEVLGGDRSGGRKADGGHHDAAAGAGASALPLVRGSAGRNHESAFRACGIVGTSEVEPARCGSAVSPTTRGHRPTSGRQPTRPRGWRPG